ncbi:SDR family NAD(P)-dependent oxidoreductase, partial [Streptomyces carpinensis]
MVNRELVIVTGGSSGIGAAVCRALAERGHAVAVNHAGNAAAAHAVADSLVADERQVQALFEEADAELGALSGLVDDDGTVGATRPWGEQEVHTPERLLAVNCSGRCCAAVPRSAGSPPGVAAGAEPASTSTRSPPGRAVSRARSP